MADSYEEELNVNRYMRGKIPYYEILGNFGDEKLRDAIVQCKNGKVFSVYKLKVCGDRMSSAIDESRTAKWTELFSMFDRRYEFTIDIVKQMKGFFYETPDADSLAECGLLGVRDVEAKRKKFYEEDSVIYSVTVYLSVCMDITSRFGNLFTTDNLEEFRNSLLVVESYLPFLGVKQISGSESGELLRGDDLYTYLLRSTTDDFYIPRKKVPYGCLDDVLSSSEEFYPSTVPFIIGGNMTQCVMLKDLPLKTFSNMFFPFISVDFPIRAIIKYNTYSKEETQKYLYAKRDEYKTHQFRMRDVIDKARTGGVLDEDEVDFSAMSGKAECDSAILHTDDTNLVGGMYSIAFLLNTLTSEEDFMKRQLETLNRIAAEQGLRIRAEKRNNTFAYLSSVMIGTNLDYRKSFLICDNVADSVLVSGSDDTAISPHLEEITNSKMPYVVSLRPDNSIYNFSPCGSTGNSGHTFITGITGSGKSIGLALMASQWLKYKNTRVVYLDMGLSMLNVVRSNGGKIFYPAVDKTSFAPFHNAKDDIDHIVAFIDSIMAANGRRCTDRDDEAIRMTCETLSKVCYGKETMGKFVDMIGGQLESDLVGILRQYVKMANGIFNSSDDVFDNPPRIIGIELEKLLNGQSEKLIYPSLTYLFNRLETLFTGDRPCLLILDEAWRFLRDDFFKSYIQNWLKTLRKKNAFVFIATQEINDLIGNDIASTIISNCHTRIFLANPHATETGSIDAYRKLGLQDYEIELVASLPQYSNVIMQEGNMEVVNFCVEDSLSDLKTTEIQKSEFIRDIEGQE